MSLSPGNKTKHLTGLCIALLLGLSISAVPSALAGTCESLAALKLPHVTITAAERVTGGTFTPPQGSSSTAPITGLPDFCRVAASAHPVPDSDIRIEVWLPETGWNGRMEGTGNGGLAGKISFSALVPGVQQGYAVANTDMGTSVPAGKDASVFVNRPERWTDWGSRSTHQMTLLARQLVKAYYGSDPKHSYFVGCSSGGEQALMEAQRFPDDYDGIVGGAPAHNRTGVHISILWNFAATQKTPESYLPPARITLLHQAVLNACDWLDGVRDGLITDPRSCNFKPETLQCKAGADDKSNSDCLSSAQVATAKALYAGPTDPRNGKQLYPGLLLGSEADWPRIAPAPAASNPAPYAPIFKWAFGPAWDWRSFDYGKDVDTLNQLLAAPLNALDPNLDTFREHGHKLLLYHGWSDWLVPPQETITYYNEARARVTPTAASSQPDPNGIDNAMRLFMVPGMAHCGGGQSPNSFDPLGAMVKWVESGVTPETLVSTRFPTEAKSATAPQQRLLCAYPLVAHYNGSGSPTNPDDPASYACTMPK